MKSYFFYKIFSTRQRVFQFYIANGQNTAWNIYDGNGRMYIRHVSF